MEATAGQDFRHPSFESLQQFTINDSSEYIESLPIGSYAPVFARETVQEPWMPCVLMRKAER
eukprot:4675993-Pleurochrysis_carterae.AAC.1